MDEHSRARDRHRRVAYSAIASFGARAIGALNLLITVPLVLGYLGPERYGLWMTVASFTALASFADFGIGLGLLNPLAEASAKGDLETARRLVSNAFVALVCIAGCLGIAA